MKELEREILIIGAGPAGLSAAIEAAKAGAKVTVADEHDTIGGQLYKQIHKFFGAADNHAGMRGFEIARKLEQEAKELGVEFWLSTVAYGIFKEGVGIVRDGDNFIVKAKKVIVAAGGIENTTAFPGSTLPGVMLAGAAQTMANIHRVLPGKRMVVVGSGNVGLIVAYQMLQAGAEVLAVVERDDHIGGYGVHAERLRTAGVPISQIQLLNVHPARPPLRALPPSSLTVTVPRSPEASRNTRPILLLWLSVWLRSPSFCGTSAAALNS